MRACKPGDGGRRCEAEVVRLEDEVDVGSELDPPPRGQREQSGGNCVNIGLPGKSFLGDYFQENRTSCRPFLLLRISFPGRPIFIQLPPAPHRGDSALEQDDGREGQRQRRRRRQGRQHRKRPTFYSFGRFGDV